MLADSPTSKASQGVPALITIYTVISSLWQSVNFHISGCILICRTFQCVWRNKTCETSPVRIQKEEEMDIYTVSNIRCVDAILCYGFGCNAQNTVVLNQVRK